MITSSQNTKKLKGKKKVLKKERIGMRVAKEQKDAIIKAAAEANYRYYGEYILDKIFNKAYETQDNIAKYNYICKMMADLRDKRQIFYKAPPELDYIFNQIFILFNKGELK